MPAHKKGKNLLLLQSLRRKKGRGGNSERRKGKNLVLRSRNSGKDSIDLDKRASAAAGGRRRLAVQKRGKKGKKKPGGIP